MTLEHIFTSLVHEQDARVTPPRQLSRELRVDTVPQPCTGLWEGLHTRFRYSYCRVGEEDLAVQLYSPSSLHVDPFKTLLTFSLDAGSTSVEFHFPEDPFARRALALLLLERSSFSRVAACLEPSSVGRVGSYYGSIARRDIKDMIYTVTAARVCLPIGLRYH